MKYSSVFALFAVIIAVYFDSCSAVSEPVCGYKNSQGEMIFLKYLPYLKQGQDYVDFGTEGTCIRRVTCLADYTNKIEECSDIKVTCDNKHLYSDGVFPKCCVKC